MRISAFAHHLVGLDRRRPHRPRSRAVAAVVEELLDDGDEDTVELVELGIVESLQNIVSHRDVEVGARRRCSPCSARRRPRSGSSTTSSGSTPAPWRHDGPRVTESDYVDIGDPDLRRYFQAHKRRLDDGVLISANDIVHYQTELAKLSPLMPAGRPQIPWPAVIVGLLLAAAAAVAVTR